jgi:HipA N-terminal domain
MPTMSRSISRPPKPVFVWIWLPGQTEPLVAGVVITSQRNDALQHRFQYAPSYLARPDRISLYTGELPLPEAQASQPQTIPSQDGLAGCLRDAMPDAWGRRVIVNQMTTDARHDAIDTDMFDETVYMLHSGSDRIGALDFQASPTDYLVRDGAIVTLDDLAAAIAYRQSGCRAGDRRGRLVHLVAAWAAELSRFSLARRLLGPACSADRSGWVSVRPGLVLVWSSLAVGWVILNDAVSGGAWMIDIPFR